MNQQTQQMTRTILDDINTIAGAVTNRSISRNLGDYLGQFALLNSQVTSAREFARQGFGYEAATTLGNAKKVLDGVAFLCIPRGPSGEIIQPMSSTMPLENQALYDHARSVYDQAVSDIQKLLGEAA